MAANEGRKPLTLPLHGHAGGVPTRHVDDLSDADLERLNELLPWRCYTVDGHGRRFGRPAGALKRTEPQVVPDERVLLLDSEFGLADKHVLEVGCFEGVHTVALCQRAASVVAVDGRVDNVVKTIVRTAFFGQSPRAFAFDLEQPIDPEGPLRCDVCFHVGVLYHLSDPLVHLERLGRAVQLGMLLDTHVADGKAELVDYESGGRSYRVHEYREGGVVDPFSGLRSFSRWLLLDDLLAAVAAVGFNDVRLLDSRDERNGRRVSLLARKG